MVSSHHPNADSGNNLFLPLPSTNRHGSTGGGAGSSMMLQDQHNTTSTGYYFMESSNDAGSCSVKAKIMGHPHYPRLLAAYVNCQKVNLMPECFKINSENPNDLEPQSFLILIFLPEPTHMTLVKPFLRGTIQDFCGYAWIFSDLLKGVRVIYFCALFCFFLFLPIRLLSCMVVPQESFSVIESIEIVFNQNPYERQWW